MNMPLIPIEYLYISLYLYFIYFYIFFFIILAKYSEFDDLLGIRCDIKDKDMSNFNNNFAA